MKKKLQFLFSLVVMLCLSVAAKAQTEITDQYLTNADLSTVDNGWTYYSDAFKYTDWKTDGDVPVVEFYSQWNSGASVPITQKDFKFSQTITLPAGNYRIAVNAFYRNGAGDGTNENKAWIFAGEKKQNVYALSSAGVGAYTGGNDLYKAANAFSKGDFSNAFDFTLEEATQIEVGFQGFFNTSLSWCILGPVKLYQYTIDDYRADYKKAVTERANPLFSAKMSSAAMLSLEGAADVNVDEFDELDDVVEAIKDLNQAIADAEVSIALYSKVKKALDDYATMAAALDEAGQAAYDVSKIQDKYDAGTINEDVTPYIAEAYADAVKSQTTPGTDMTSVVPNAAGDAAVGADNWQLANARAEGEEFRLDTWAGTASGMSTPHIEYWHVKGTNLSDNTISQTIEGLTPGTYTVTATTAVNNENNVALEEGSAIFFANDAEADITEVVEGVSIATDFSGTTGTFSVEATVEDDGELTIGFKTVGANYNWLAFKDVTLTLVEAAPASAPEPDAWFVEDNFRVKDYLGNEDATTEQCEAWESTVPRWVADPEDATNGCIAITSNNNSGETHYCQFWIKASDIALPLGSTFTLKMSVKADREVTVSAQAHKNFAYLGWGNPLESDLSITTEWKDVELKGEVKDGQYGSSQIGMTDVCFNLSEKNGQAINYYFDNIEVTDLEIAKADWYNATEIHAKDYYKENEEDPDPTYTDSDDPHPLARYIYDAEGDYVEVVSNKARNNTYESQIWIAIPAEYVGKNTKMTMQVWADEAVTCDENYHATATGKGWGASAKPGTGLVTEADKWIDITRILSTKDVKCNGVYKDMQVDYYVLDLSNDAQTTGDGVTYRFRNIKFDKAAEDWYTNNVITVDGEQAPYIYGTGEEGGYVEVAGGKQITFVVPENLQGAEVEILMNVKGSVEGSATAAAGDGIDFTTSWNAVSAVFDATESANYVLTLPAEGTFDFDELSFKKYFAPVEYGDLVEIPLDGTLVKELDLTTATSFSSSWDLSGNVATYSKEFEAGTGLVIVNEKAVGMWDPQFFIMEGFDLYAGKDYAVRYTLKYQGDGGNMQINMGSWGTNTQGVQALAAGPIYTHMVQEFPAWSADAAGSHIIFQSGAITGRLIVEKIEVYDITPNYDDFTWTGNILTNGDLEGEKMDEFVGKIVKGDWILDDNDEPIEFVYEDLDPETRLLEASEYVEEWAQPLAGEAGPNGLVLDVAEWKDGTGNDHDSQIWLRLPYALPEGTLFQLEFDYTGSNTADAIELQAHREPSQYIANFNKSIKPVTNADEEWVWSHFSEYLKAPKDMRSIAFNLGSANGGIYLFDNFSVKLVEDDMATIDAFTAEWAEPWAEALALNEAIHEAKATETEGKGYSLASIAAFEDAIVAGKAEFTGFGNKSDKVNAETLTAAAAAVDPATALKYPAITIDENIENGEVGVVNDLTEAAAGTKVTLTNTPAANFQFEAYKVVYLIPVEAEEEPAVGDEPAAGDEEPVAGDEEPAMQEVEVPVAADGSFTMPAYDVIVSATFTAAAAEKDAWFNEIDFCFRDKGSSDAALKERSFAVWGVDPDDPTNGCIVATAGANSSATNAQFWIRGAEYVEPTYMGENKTELTAAYGTGGFAEGQGFKVTMRVKANGEYSVGSQTHQAFQHKSNDGFGSLNVTTDWQWVTFVCVADAARAGFTDLTFNLAASGADRVFYFDDIQIVRGAEWYLNNSDIHAKDYYKENEEDPDPTYTDSDEPHPLARYVADAEGGYVEVISNKARNNTYESQIWIAIPAEYVGKNTKMTMQVWADEAVTCDENYHATATGKGWGASAKPGTGLVTEADKWIDITRILSTKDVKCNGVYKDMQVDYYVLDLSNDAQTTGDGVTYRFRNIKFDKAAEDWYTNNVITVDGEQAPYIYGTGEEGGYVEVAGGKQITFVVPENLQGAEVEILMNVKGSVEGSATAAAGDGIDFTTSWNAVSAVFDATESANYVLTLPAEGTFDFDELSFKKYFAPVEYGDLVEIPLDGTLVKELDLTTATSFSSSWDLSGNVATYSKEFEAGTGLVIVNEKAVGMWDPQFFIMEGFDLYAGKDYAVRYTLKYQGDGGNMQINMGSWGTNTQGVQALAAGPIYTHMVQEFPAWSADAAGSHIIFQSGAITGRLIVEKIEVYDITPNYDDFTWTGNILTNGDLEGEKMDEFVGKIVKGDYILDDNDEPIEFVYEDLDPETLLLAATDYEDYWEQPLANDEVGGSNGLSLEVAEWKDGKGNDHDSQIWLRLPYALPEGTVFQLEFDYAGSNTADAIELQAHREPGQYIANFSKSIKPVTNADEEWVWSHYSEYLKAPKDMRSIAFNLGSESGGIYLFDNFSVKLVEDDMDFIQDFTAEWDEPWAETLELNETIYLGKNTETEGMGYTEASVNYLEETIAAGKAQVVGFGNKNENVTAETLAQATQDILDAIAGLTDEEFVPLPDLTEYYVPIPQDQGKGLDTFARAETSEGIFRGDSFVGYTTSTDTEVAIKLQNVDVADCDAVVLYFAQPVPAGWKMAFWGVQDPSAVDPIPAGATSYTFEFDKDPLNGAKGNAVVNDVLKEITLMTLWSPANINIKVYGIYKHLANDPISVDIADVSDDAATSKVRKYIENGQIVIVKDGKKYNTAGVEIE